MQPLLISSYSSLLLLDGPQNKPSYVLFILRLPLLLQTSNLRTNPVMYCSWFSFTSGTLDQNHLRTVQSSGTFQLYGHHPSRSEIGTSPCSLCFYGLHGHWTRTARYDRRRLVIGTLKIKPSFVLIRAGTSPWYVTCLWDLSTRRR